MILANLPQHHSATVKLFLIIADDKIPLAQLGPDFVILRQSYDLAPCDAEIVMEIEDHENRWSIRLVNGIRAGDRRVTITSKSP